MVHLISRSEAVLAMVKAGLKTSTILHALDSRAFLAAVLHRPYSTEECVIVDLSTVTDAEHIIGFTKTSALSRLPMVVLGTEEAVDSLSDEVQALINGLITAPYTPGEIAAVVASLTEQRLPAEPPLERS